MLRFVLAYALVVSTGVATADWPMFRGARVDGHAVERGLLSRTSDVRLQVRWKKPLGSGYSSVVTSNGKAYTAYADGGSEYVACFSNADGETIWKQRTGATWVGANGSFDGPVATPAVGFGHVYMLTPAGLLVALNADTGEPAWTVNVPETFETTPVFYGFGASPIIGEQHVLVELGAKRGNLCAFDPLNGKLAWAVGEDTAGYQNPVPVRVGGDDVLIWAGNTSIGGVDPVTGASAFAFEHGGIGARGAWSLIPVPLPNGKLFLAHDDTKSRVVSLNESSDQWSVEPTWDGRTVRNSYNVPVAVNDDIYAFSSRVLTCVDGSTGKTKWRSRKPGDGFISVVDGHFVIITKAGTMHLAKVSDEDYDEIAETPVFSDVTWSLPAIDGNAAYVRSIGEIARVDIVPGSANEMIVEKTEVGPKFERFLGDVAKADDKAAVVDQFLEQAGSMPFVEGDVVHFVARGDYQDVAVASDLFGARQERTLTRVDGTNLFYYATRVPEDARLSYVFIADFNTITDPLNPRTVKSSLLVEDIELVFLSQAETLTMSWFDMPKRSTSVEPSVDHSLAGALVETSLTSKAMSGEQIALTVYTPPGFADDHEPYPVVFVHDGAAARQSGKLHVLVDQLITGGTIRDAVVVFIDRRFNPMVGAAGYEQMLGSELLPMVQDKFNVSAERADHGSMGGSFGGFLALTSSMANRGSIGKLALQSPHWFEFIKPMIDGTIATPGPTSDVLVHWGQFEIFNPEENWDMGKMAQIVADDLKVAGHNVTAREVPGGSDWICWRSHAEEVLTFLVGQPE